ncbi:MAG: WbqC family protein [Candidatus Peregrinibacteria bacterium]|nr:WbqC family protein [Candidatus Peregrinibacteria bacterium]
MRLAAHQPNYLPNIGFFNKMWKAEKFVLFTNVQFSKGDGWVRRHKIKGPNKDVWLTVPVLGSSSEQQIRDVHIDNSHTWRPSHRATIRQAYAHTQERDALERICAVYDRKWDRLADLNIAFILEIKDILGIETPVIIDEEVTGEKYALLINLCKRHAANGYLSGMGGKEYMTEEYFAAMREHGIDHQFVENNLTALYPYTILHYLFTEGKEHLMEIVREEVTEPLLVLTPA